MTTISLKASVGYWLRLFGYFFGLVMVSGGISAGGVYLLDEAEAWPGGPGVDLGVELAGGIALTTIGGLLLFAGLFVIALNVVADGVRRGVEATQSKESRSEDGADTTNSEDESEAVTFPPGATASGRRATRDEHPADSDTEPARSDDDERWKREVEEKLASSDSRSPELSAGAERTTDQRAPAQESEPTEPTDRPQEPFEQPSTPIERGAEADADEWVSGEAVREHDDAPTGDRRSEQQNGSPRDDREDTNREGTAEKTDPLAPEPIEPRDDVPSEKKDESGEPSVDDETSGDERTDDR